MVNKRHCNYLSVPHCLCWLSYFQIIIPFLFEKLRCAVQILIWSDAVNFLTKLLGMPYSVVTAQQACSTEMVKPIRNSLRLMLVHSVLFSMLAFKRWFFCKDSTYRICICQIDSLSLFWMAFLVSDLRLLGVVEMKMWRKTHLSSLMNLYLLELYL